jgi:predicted dehydrogenase
MGRNHARVYADTAGCELVGVADCNRTLAESVGRRLGVPAFEDYRQMLDTTAPDAVSIAVPTAEHLDVALEAIGRGIHLLVEKPIASTHAEAERMVSAAREAGVCLMIGHVERFNPAVLQLRERLSQGELGRVFQIDARRQGPFPARLRDVGVVIDLAVHDLDIIRFVTGLEVRRVYAETERRIHTTHEDLLAGMLRLEDGTVGTLTVNWLTPTKIRELYVTGERGMFRVDYLTQDLYFYENSTASPASWDTLQALRGVTEGWMMRHVVRKREPLVCEIEAFVRAVTEGGESPMRGEDAIRSLHLAEALVASGIRQTPVSVSPEAGAASERALA